jgi:hypothetical protein
MLRSPTLALAALAALLGCTDDLAVKERAVQADHERIQARLMQTCQQYQAKGIAEHSAEDLELARSCWGELELSEDIWSEAHNRRPNAPLANDIPLPQAQKWPSYQPPQSDPPAMVSPSEPVSVSAPPAGFPPVQRTWNDTPYAPMIPPALRGQPIDNVTPMIPPAVRGLQ